MGVEESKLLLIAQVTCRNSLFRPVAAIYFDLSQLFTVHPTDQSIEALAF